MIKKLRKDFLKQSGESPSTSLESLVYHCSHLLAGHPSAYIGFLHLKNIKSIGELEAAVIYDLETLANGNDEVRIKSGERKLFSEAVVSAASALAGRTETSQENEEDKKEKQLELEKANKANAKRARKAALRKKTKNDKAKRREDGERIKRLQELIKAAKESIVVQKAQLEDIQAQLGTKKNQLKELRANIGLGDDLKFHIDRSRDNRGFTFLMVSAQNNDLATAKTCFELGADAFDTSLEGHTAIDFSYFFGFELVTKLIVQVRLTSHPAVSVSALSYTNCIEVNLRSIEWWQSTDKAM